LSRPLAAPALLAAALAAGPAAATTPVAAPAASDAGACLAAIAEVEPGSGLPPGLLGAIAIVESGRADPRTGAVLPWPWAYNAAGEGHHAPTREAAVAAVVALRARGVSVDVGCMQVNLHHHPDAFASVADAFDPRANVRYAALFLARLRAETGSIGAAVARYHSGDPARGAGYAARVALAQLGRAWGRTPGRDVAIELGGARGCGRGARAVLILHGIAGAGGGSTARIACRGGRREPAATPRAPEDGAPVAAIRRAPRRPARLAAR